MAMPKAVRNFSLCPYWFDGGKRVSLADCSGEIESAKVVNAVADEASLQFEIVYKGSFSSVTCIREIYRMTDAEVCYEVHLEGISCPPGILFPVLKSDGVEETELRHDEGGFEVTYREGRFSVSFDNKSDIQFEEQLLLANRNAVYYPAYISSNQIRIISKESAPGAGTSNL
jgi:hypothetical protein